jgi:hypothetical protein
MYLWVQDGWDTDERHVVASAKSVGLADPTLFLFLPARDKSDLISAIVAKEAVELTIGSRGTPTTPEGQDAKKMMEMKAAQAEEQIQRTLNAAFAEARVFIGGGTGIDSGSTLEERLQAAGQAALARLYKYFEKVDAADKSLWTKVIEKAKQGATDALVVLGHEAEPDKHLVCADILSFLGATGRKGAEVQEKFETAPYGWPRDAIQAALMALLAAGYLRAKDAAGNPIEATRLERNKITQTHFAAEKVKLTAPQLIAVKGALKVLGISCNSGEEQAKALEAASRLRALRDAAGGDAPLPEKPPTALIEALEARSGNDLLLELCTHKTEIEKAANEWKTTAEEIAQRKPGWDQATQLFNAAETLPGAKAWGEKLAEVGSQRALLDTPNPVSPIAHGLTELLRTVLNGAVAAFGVVYDDEMAALAADADWRRLDRTKQQSILENEGLNSKPSADSRSAESILAGLAHCDLTRWQERIHALPARFDAVRQKVAQALEIKPVTVKLPRRILRTETDVRAWLTDVEGTLLAKVAQAPIQL